MSDFDEEAERERLREKYERDEERRKETQQMSELLLKGATMTNRHCNDCGSPIFRYQGQEFCPSCQRVTGEGDADAQAGDGQTAADRQAAADEQATAAQQPGPDAQTTSDERGAAADGAASGVGVADEARTATPEAATAGRGAGVGSQADVADDAGGEPSTPQDAERPAPTRDTGLSTPTADATSASADDRGAREALLGALTRHARLAEETDDPRRAKEHLAAAREAAAALDELD
ncbi:Sjogren's syndrome/scleroderma autoantigen 1 family protein [Halobellus salinisoli]|uniref:Sjogren's syndrome/scleroderma autoantigen 1 family protein n=1 Tax=Halobellus salinisoli TaxID=3108500 RepID=UPI00300B7BBA